MSPHTPDVVNTTRGFPRVSGDEPVTDIRPTELELFSPRERG